MPPHGPDLLEALRELPLAEGRPRADERLLLALSGGLDSVVLLDLLERLGIRFEAFHLDHGLRPESVEDAEFCAQLCAERGIPLHRRTLAIAELAAAEGANVEATGRAARYRLAEEIREARGLDLVATAHHRDDHVETLLMWLFRGCGPAAMAGIRPRQGRLLRPLRGFGRQELHDYALWRGLAWREDPSNADPGFLRNRLRTEFIPLLESIFDAGAGERLAAFARRSAQEHGLLAGLAADLLAGLQRPEGGFDLALYRQLDPALQRLLLRELLGETSRRGVHQRYVGEDWARLADFAQSAAAGRRCPLPGGGWLHVGRSCFEVELEAPPEARAETLLAESLPPSEAMFTFSEREAYFDADRLRLPLRLRPVQPGDRMQPAGRSSRKRLVDLLREGGVPSWHRSSSLVVEDAEGIIWAVGHAIDASRRPTGQTRRVLRVQVARSR